MSEGAARLSRVEVFASGNHRGKLYKPRDIDDMVRNFNTYSTGPKAALRVPGVLGHEEKQDLLERSDLPAAGWGAKAYASWGTDPATGKRRRVMHVDFEDVAPPAVRLFKGKAYRKCSAEVYDDSEQAGLPPGKGKVLRRVAWLGGDPPQVKGLADIPTPEPHSEPPFARPRPVVLKFSESYRTRAGSWVCFAEVTSMDRDAILQKLGQHGCDIEALKNVDDAALAEMLRVCEAKAAEKEDEDEKPEELEQHGDREGDGDGDGDGEEHESYDDLPEPKDDKERQNFAACSRKMAERARKMAEHYSGRKFDEEVPEEERHADFSALPEAQNKAMWAKVTAAGKGTRVDSSKGDKSRHYKRDRMKSNWDESGGAAGENPMPKKVTTTQHFSERQLEQVIERILDKKVSASIGKLEKFAEQQEGAQRRAAVDAILDELGKDGKVPPAEREAEREVLMALDPVTVQKFNEGGKTVSQTPFARRVAMLRRRPSKFSEKVGSGTSRTTDKGATSDRKQWAQQTFEKFSESFQKVGVSRETLIQNAEKADDATFQAMQKEWENLPAA